MNSGRMLVVLWLLLYLACATRAQEARLTNAKMESQPVKGELDRTFRALMDAQEEAAWIGYAVPVVEGNFHICCSSSDDRHLPVALRHYRCKLEGRDEGMNFQTSDEGDAREKAENLLVLYRITGRSVGKIRVFTGDCELDAGGLKVLWLTEVKPEESIELLASFVRENQEGNKTGRKTSEAAICAISLHADPGADRALERFIDPKRPAEVRKDTAFWLGNMRGQRGYEILRRMVQDDPNDKVREQCIFALHISKVPQAINTIIEIARKDKSAHLRGQALFWLSQKAGEKAARAISDAVENDPETDVKKKAVFALSQLPKEQGTPKLIQVARMNRNREIRKDAIFWLGQSNDPRALDFFEEVLTH